MKKYALFFSAKPAVNRNIQKFSELNSDITPLQCVFESEKHSPFADEFCITSSQQAFENILNYVGENEVVFAHNRIDPYVKLHSRLVDHFDIPGPSQKSTQFFRDKSAMHSLLEENGLGEYRPHTKVVTLDSLEEELIKSELPVIVKPEIGVHSKGVFKVSNKTEIPAAVKILTDHYRTHYKDALNSDHQPTVLIEEFLDGKMLVPVSYVDHTGELHTIVHLDIVKGNEVGENHNQLLYRSTYSHFSEKITRESEFLLQKLIDLTGLKSTQLDPEFMVVDDKLFLIEVNVRIGGLRYEPCKYAFGLDLDLIGFSLGFGKIPTARKQFIEYCTGAEVWSARSGVIKEFKLPDYPGMYDIRIYFQPGDTYTAPPDGNVALAKLYVHSQNQSSLDLMKKIREDTIIRFEE